ncbi:uncharacterized protein RJT20DRAFT_65592 [Scheffersomyces xylosifermentans]|uniref:uncharacterized protein n=1 Tax=Scheffersomyces xylosifermentans TaxID=1304137 RepID=UPI00315D391B
MVFIGLWLGFSVVLRLFVQLSYLIFGLFLCCFLLYHIVILNYLFFGNEINS